MVEVPQTRWIMALLGLVSGHWDIDQKAKTTGDIFGEIRTAINSGIAAVTPAEAIRELLMDDEDVLEDRKQRASEMRHAHDLGPRLDA